MARIPGLRRRILLVAISVTAVAILWPVGRDLAVKLAASYHRSDKVGYHRRAAANLTKQAATIKPWRYWEREYRQMLLDTSTWHTRRAEAFRSADDAQLDDEDMADKLGGHELKRQLELKVSEAPTWY